MPSFDWNIRVLEETPSTQDIVKNEAQNGVKEGLVYQSYIQRAGKGRHGRIWESPKGNLYMSILLRPECPAAEVGQIALLIGVSIAKVIKPFLITPEALFLKWPNDVLYEGRKLCGILLESHLDHEGKIEWLVAGMGINVELAPFEDSIAINQISKEAVKIDVLRDLVLNEIEELYELWKTNGFDAIRLEWLSHAYEKGVKTGVKIGEKRLEGLFEGLSQEGHLLLRDKEDNIRTISAGDVYFADGDR